MYTPYDAYLECLYRKDETTYLHSLRVADITRSICKDMGINGVLADVIYEGAKYHDIGKAEIEEKVLKKHGCYTLRERKIIERHPEIGHEIMLRFSVNFPVRDEVLDIVLMHHERLDGSGYPAGLTKDKIPLHVRIVSAADVFVALQENRYYRKAKSIKDAADDLRQGRDITYDADVVDCLLRPWEHLLVHE